MSIKASVLLLTYNQEKFIEEALLSILNQDYDNLEIVISDDNSQDGTWKIIQEIITDHPNKQVILNKNDKNLGVVGNYNRAFSLSSGELIFTAAGDDISLPNRCSSCIEFWLSNNKPDLLAADAYDMAIDGSNLGVKKADPLEDWDFKKWGKKRPYFFGASHMMSRKLITINTLDPNLPYEDQCFVLRGIALGTAKNISKPLVLHRRGGLTQQSKGFLEKSKKEHLITGIKHSICELSQMLTDIQILKMEDYYKIISRKLDEHKFYLHILTSEKKIKILRDCILKTNVNTSKKIRFLCYALIPSLMELINKKNK